MSTPLRDSTAVRFLAATAVRVHVRLLREADTPRVGGEQDDHARALAESGGVLPPIIVHRQSMRVIDGMHRLKAARLRGEDRVEVLFFDGNDRDAFVLAVEANIAHGLPLSLADRTAAAQRIMGTHPEWSDRAIAAVTRLSARTVSTLRARAGSDIPRLRARVGRDGRVRPLDSTQGRIRAAELLTSESGMSLREVARRAGISAGTVRDVRQRLERGEDPVPSRHQREDGTPRERGPRMSREGRAADRTSDPAPLLRRLRRDPSLRFSETGRTLLRLMAVQTVFTGRWKPLAEHVPDHCVGLVADTAHVMAGSWSRFAEELERRRPPVAD